MLRRRRQRAALQTARLRLSDILSATNLLQDVREYMLDLLTAYAALQRFKPEPTPGAERVTAAALLDHFLYQEDRAEITRAHPWLACAAERGL